VLCVRVALNHPLPDGNKRTAFISMIEFLHRNGYRWRSHPDDPDATAHLIENVAAGKVSVESLAWIISSRIEPLSE
jgi:death-on-curing protein